MRKKNFKRRCEKRKLSKCEDACRTFDAIPYAYADLLDGSEDIKSFRVNEYPVIGHMVGLERRIQGDHKKLLAMAGF